MSGPNVEDYTPAWPGRSLWEQAGDDRWRMVDEIGVMHLLLKVGARFFELHGLTLHVYDGPAEIDDPAWPMGNPITFNASTHAFVHAATYDESASPLTTFDVEEDVWEWLAEVAKKDRAAR